jgi:ferredoxin, 2Fe-2S
MPTVIFESPDHTRREVAADDGKSVMMAAVSNGIDGIEAECGGTCSCATCHVYVGESFLELLPAPEPQELEMLDFVAAERKANSRLSCQIVVGPSLDGLIVQLPETQVM